MPARQSIPWLRTALLVIGALGVIPLLTVLFGLYGFLGALPTARRIHEKLVLFR